MATKSVAMPGLGDLAGSIGERLDNIEGKPVTVVKIEATVRPLFNAETQETEDKDIVIVTLDDGSVYYTWSPSLAEKLGAIQPDSLPAVGVFRKARTRAGFEVWTVSNS